MLILTKPNSLLKSLKVQGNVCWHLNRVTLLISDESIDCTATNATQVSKDEDKR